MAYVASAFTSSAVLPRSLRVPQIAPRAKRGLFLRLLDAIEESNKRRAEREIARYLGTHKFTDETEREIERRFIAK
jgi:hypothetical protein